MADLKWQIQNGGRSCRLWMILMKWMVLRVRITVFPKKLLCGQNIKIQITIHKISDDFYCLWANPYKMLKFSRKMIRSRFSRTRIATVESKFKNCIWRIQSSRFKMEEESFYLQILKVEDNDFFTQNFKHTYYFIGTKCMYRFENCRKLYMTNITKN